MCTKHYTARWRMLHLTVNFFFIPFGEFFFHLLLLFNSKIFFFFIINIYFFFLIIFCDLYFSFCFVVVYVLCTALVRRMRTTTHARNKIFSPVQAKQTYEGICKNCSGIACKISVRAGGSRIAPRRLASPRVVHPQHKTLRTNNTSNNSNADRANTHHTRAKANNLQQQQMQRDGY